MTLSVATGHMDGMISCEMPFPDGAKGVLRDDQSHFPVAPVSSGLPDAHLKAIKEYELARMLPEDSLVLLKHVATRLACWCGDFVTCIGACSWMRSFGQAEDAAGILCEEFSAAGYERGLPACGFHETNDAGAVVGCCVWLLDGWKVAGSTALYHVVMLLALEWWPLACF
ncbi:hypothetical protein Nepgr_009335 [Nepenthes gracilis]|uniref:Uncharacterized protein n=1 Tax=Nepenthes gracilis TaxID=150966 RepID=A0AAD3SAU8_NEPGR|nr:hypothetical protein Nepgr_009335 [Nepenthes gracilis]